MRGLSWSTAHGEVYGRNPPFAREVGKEYPIIAVGGIMSEADAIEKLNAGADLIQIYTGFVYEGPALSETHQQGNRSEAVT